MKTYLDSFLFKKGFRFQLMKKKKSWEYIEKITFSYIEVGAFIPMRSRQFLMVILDLSTKSNLTASSSAPITGTDL